MALPVTIRPVSKPVIAQSTLIAIAIFLAFIVFITARGELPAYIAVFTGGGSPGAGAPGTAAAGANTTSTGAFGALSQGVNLLNNASKLFGSATVVGDGATTIGGTGAAGDVGSVNVSGVGTLY